MNFYCSFFSRFFSTVHNRDTPSPKTGFCGCWPFFAKTFSWIFQIWKRQSIHNHNVSIAVFFPSSKWPLLTTVLAEWWKWIPCPVFWPRSEWLGPLKIFGVLFLQLLSYWSEKITKNLRYNITYVVWIQSGNVIWSCSWMVCKKNNSEKLQVSTKFWPRSDLRIFYHPYDSEQKIMKKICNRNLTMLFRVVFSKLLNLDAQESWFFESGNSCRFCKSCIF